MNSYLFSISGSWYLLSLLILTSVLVSIFAYRITNPPISKKKKMLLISLRSLALIFLIFSLFEPVIRIISGKDEDAQIALLMDNSQSMNLKIGNENRKLQYQETYTKSLLNNFENKITSLFDELTFRKNEFSFDSLNFKGSSTDISQSIRSIANYQDEKNIKAIVLFSDGNYNLGNSPIYDAQSIGLPVYTVGIGDTINPRDLMIKSIVTNDIAYVNSLLPISLNVAAFGFSDTNIVVSFYDNGNLIEKKSLQIFKNQSDYDLNFTYKPSIEGIHKFSFEITQFPNELITKNNLISEFVKVLKNKRKIGIFAGSLNSDISFIKQSLASMDDISIDEFIQKSGSDFYNFPTENKLNDLEMIVLIGFPVNSTPPQVINLIEKELSKGKPLLFIASQNLDYSKLKVLEPYLPFNVANSKSNEFQVSLDINKDFVSNSIFKISGSDADAKLWNNLPPIFRTETFVRMKPESEVISTLKINNTSLNEPLITQRDFQGKKSIGIIGYGLYRWKLLGYASDVSKGKKDAIDLYSTFINNTFKWLSVDDLNKKFILRTNKKFYSQGEKVEIIGQAYDNSYNPIDDAVIKVELSSKNEKREFTLISIGNGRYTNYIENLPSGDFELKGSCKFKNQNMGNEISRFNIGEQTQELLNYTMNKEALKSLSNLTGGKFYTKENVSSLINDIKNDKKFKSRGVTLNSEYPLWNRPLLLILVILFLSIEWFIHKRSGMI